MSMTWCWWYGDDDEDEEHVDDDDDGNGYDDVMMAWWWDDDDEMETTWWWWLSSPSPSFHLDVNIIIIMWWWHGNDYDDDDDDDNNNDDDGTMLFSFYHCKMLHILQWTHCKFTVLPGIFIVNLQCTMPLHCKFTVGTSREIDLKAMAFTVAIQWLYSGYTVYLQCAHCKIIQWRELLSSLPL